MDNNNLSNDVINLKNYEGEITNINNNIIELTNLIDKKSLKIYEINENNNKKILNYKFLLENIILEYHKTCKELFKND
jgi:hypothetical protein